MSPNSIALQVWRPDCTAGDCHVPDFSRYSEQWSMYSVQCVVCEQCVLCSYQCEVCSMQCAMCSVQCIRGSVPCSFGIVDCALGSVGCAVLIFSCQTLLPRAGQSQQCGKVFRHWGEKKKKLVLNWPTMNNITLVIMWSWIFFPHLLKTSSSEA